MRSRQPPQSSAARATPAVTTTRPRNARCTRDTCIRRTVRGVVEAGITTTRTNPPRRKRTMTLNTTLLELVNAVSEHAQSDAEVIATVVYLVNSGRVRLCGTFRGVRID